MLLCGAHMERARNGCACEMKTRHLSVASRSHMVKIDAPAWPAGCAKSVQHPRFPSGHPPQYSEGLTGLNFGKRNGNRCFPSSMTVRIRLTHSPHLYPESPPPPSQPVYHFLSHVLACALITLSLSHTRTPSHPSHLHTMLSTAPFTPHLPRRPPRD